MRHYSKILVPYDGTISTEHTLRSACRIARWNNSQVLVAVPFFSQDDKGGFKAAIQSGVELISREEKIDMATVFQDGRPSDMIIDVANQRGNDLIVLGKREMTALEKLVISSFSGRIINHSKSDVFVIPEEAPVRWWNRILLCADRSKPNTAAVDNAIAYAKHYQSTIHAVSVVDLGDEFYALSPDGANRIITNTLEFMEGIVERTKNAGVDAESSVREGDPAVKILEAAGEIKANIIFVGSNERVGIMSVLMGSVARKIAMNAECPVFIIKQ